MIYDKKGPFIFNGQGVGQPLNYTLFARCLKPPHNRIIYVNPIHLFIGTRSAHFWYASDSFEDTITLHHNYFSVNSPRSCASVIYMQH